VKYTRYENKSERKIDSLQKEIDELKNPPQKRGGKVAVGIDKVEQATYKQRADGSIPPQVIGAKPNRPSAGI
jgi:hypothetical protein